MLSLLIIIIGHNIMTRSKTQPITHEIENLYIYPKIRKHSFYLFFFFLTNGEDNILIKYNLKKNSDGWEWKYR